MPAKGYPGKDYTTKSVGENALFEGGGSEKYASKEDRFTQIESNQLLLAAAAACEDKKAEDIRISRARPGRERPHRLLPDLQWGPTNGKTSRLPTRSNFA
jgi:hypothetical protein